jgi:hypothetical protein
MVQKPEPMILLLLKKYQNSLVTHPYKDFCGETYVVEEIQKAE